MRHKVLGDFVEGPNRALGAALGDGIGARFDYPEQVQRLRARLFRSADRDCGAGSRQSQRWQNIPLMLIRVDRAPPFLVATFHRRRTERRRLR